MLSFDSSIHYTSLEGCNLSSILFIIYISELGQRLSDSGCGVTLPSGEVISYLKFADDIFLVSNCDVDLDELKQILEGWCYNFRMKISAKKTQVIAQGEFDWVITDTDGGALIELKQVSEYKYLGVEQKLSLTETSKAKGLSMVDRAKKYRGAIARLKRTVPDQVAVYRALWESVAVPGILYGVEALPVSMAVIKELDDIQRWVAKVLLGVGTSTIGAVSELEMGFRPFHMRILVAKVNFYLKVKSGKGKCELSRTCMELLGTLQSSAYLLDLERLLEPVGLTLDQVDRESVQVVQEYFESEVIQIMSTKTTLMLMPIPFKWWSLSSHVEEGYWSKVLSRFRAMNAGLGNRSAFYKDKAVFVDNGRVVHCPLCLEGPNDEFHMVMKCAVMGQYRRQVKLRGNVSLEDELQRIRSQCSPESEIDCFRLFLGQELGVPKIDMMHRGWALSEMVDFFFLEWSRKFGSIVQRRRELPKVNCD